MKKAIISVLGQDRPGIIAAVTGILFNCDCNVENVSQTILQAEFSGIFIVSMPDGFSATELQTRLREGAANMNLHIHVRDIVQHNPDPIFIDAESFVITARGPDRKGLVANISEVIAGFGVNVTNLQAIFKGGDDPNKNIMIYEVDVPRSIDYQTFYTDLRKRGDELGLEISIQHRQIFEAINRMI